MAACALRTRLAPTSAAFIFMSVLIDLKCGSKKTSDFGTKVKEFGVGGPISIFKRTSV